MTAQYKAWYHDENGSESIAINNDGHILTTTIRGVTFTSQWFEDLEPEAGSTTEQLASFTLFEGDLCHFQLECLIPLPVVTPQRVAHGILHVHITLGKPTSEGRIAQEILKLTLFYQNKRITSSSQSGYFEDELLDIQKQLPHNTYMHACINCMYSDYSPFGSGIFGDMMCFRNNKKQYLAVTSKVDYWDVYEAFEEHVQETHRCEEFTLRKPGTGYRG
jgi:hypothetical protein